MNYNQNANIQEDASNLRKAMKGLGTDEDTIIKIVANRNYIQRKQIYDSYRSQFDRDLISDLKSELRGKLEDIIIALFTDPIEYDAIELKKAMKGSGTNEDTLIEILASRPPWYIQKIKEIYKIKYNKELIDDIKSELSGDLKKVMEYIVNCIRSENTNIDENYCNQKVEELYNAGENKIGTNEDVFYKIFTECSSSEIYRINEIYNSKYGHDLKVAVNKEFGGKVKTLLYTMIYCISNPTEYFATRINTAIKGAGTNDKLLIRIMVSRSEVDLNNIKTAYHNLYNKDMVQAIKDDTSGDYKKFLVEMLN